MIDNGDAQPKEFNFETPLGKLQAKGYHLGNVLQIVIAGAIVAGVLIAVQMWRDAEHTWERMARSVEYTQNQANQNARFEHDSLRASQDKMATLMDQNNQAIRFQTCINSVPIEQRVNQLRKYSACWYMSQGYTYEELGPQKLK